MTRLPDAPVRVHPRVVAAVVALAYLTLNLRGATQFNLVGEVSILLTYPVAIGLGLAAALAILVRGRLRLHRTTLVAYVLAVVLTAWIALRGIGGPTPVRSITLFGIQGMGMLLLLGSSTFVRDRETLLRCTQYVYLVGAVLATVGLGLYVGVLAPWIPLERFISTSADNWSLIFMQANVILYRYTGFVGDPNFYPFYACIALFCGLVSTNYRHPLNLLGLGALQITILLSMSRAFYASIAVSVVVVVIVVLTEGERPRLFGLSLRGFGGLTAFAITVISLVAIRYPNEAQAWVARRLFGTLFNDRRFTETWPTLIEGIVQRPLVGHGARSAETMLGQTAHSALFGLLYDFGVVGLVLWFALFFYGTRAALGAVVDREPLATPWLVGLLVSFGMNLMNSFQYDMMLWLLLGIAVSPAIVAERSGPGQTSDVTDRQSLTATSATDSPGTGGE